LKLPAQVAGTDTVNTSGSLTDYVLANKVERLIITHIVGSAVVVAILQNDYDLSATDISVI
jgi:hypothetical protein